MKFNYTLVSEKPKEKKKAKTENPVLPRRSEKENTYITEKEIHQKKCL